MTSDETGQGRGDGQARGRADTHARGWPCKYRHRHRWTNIRRPTTRRAQSRIRGVPGRARRARTLIMTAQRGQPRYACACVWSPVRYTYPHPSSWGSEPRTHARPRHLLRVQVEISPPLSFDGPAVPPPRHGPSSRLAFCTAASEVAAFLLSLYSTLRYAHGPNTRPLNTTAHSSSSSLSSSSLCSSPSLVSVSARRHHPRICLCLCPPVCPSVCPSVRYIVSLFIDGRTRLCSPSLPSRAQVHATASPRHMLLTATYMYYAPGLPCRTRTPLAPALAPIAAYPHP